MPSSGFFRELNESALLWLASPKGKKLFLALALVQACVSVLSALAFLQVMGPKFWELPFVETVSADLLGKMLEASQIVMQVNSVAGIVAVYFFISATAEALRQKGIGTEKPKLRKIAQAYLLSALAVIYSVLSLKRPKLLAVPLAAVLLWLAMGIAQKMSAPLYYILALACGALLLVYIFIVGLNWARLLPTLPIFLSKKMPAFEAISESWEMTKKHEAKIFLAYAAIIACCAIATAVLGFAFSTLGKIFAAAIGMREIASIAQFLPMLFIYPFFGMWANYFSALVFSKLKEK